MNGPTCIRCGKHHETGIQVSATNETARCLQDQIDVLKAELFALKSLIAMNIEEPGRYVAFGEPSVNGRIGD